MWSILCLAAVLSQTPDRSVLVMPLEGRAGVTPAVTLAIQDVLTSEMRRVPGFKVVTLSDVEQMMSQELRQQLAGCNTEGCLAEIAGALQAQELVYGTLGKLGEDELVLTLTRVEPGTARALGGESERLSGKNSDAMLDGVPRVLQRLYKDYVPPAPRVQPMRAWILGAALTALGAMTQYGMFSSIFTCAFFLFPLTPPLLLAGILVSTLACAVTPVLNTWQQAYFADALGRRQTGTRWAALAGLGVLGAAVMLAPLAGILASAPWVITGGGYTAWAARSTNALQGVTQPSTLSGALATNVVVGALSSGGLVFIAFFAASMMVLAVGTVTAPVVQALVLLWKSQVRPESVQSQSPGLYAPHESVPHIFHFLPRWLMGGREEVPDTVETPPAPPA